MALQLFGDFGLVGSFDQTPATYQDRQTCINWYPERAASAGAKVATALLGAPGLVPLVSAPGGGAPGFNPAMTAWPQPYSGPQLPVRALWVLPGRTQMLAVIGSGVYVVGILAQGSYSTPGALSLSLVGSLNTSSGAVIIRDDGTQGGNAALVDGAFAYLYSMTAHTVAQITDPQFTGGATHAAFIDGWWVFNQGGSPVFYTNSLPYSSGFNASLFALKDGFSDFLVGLMELKEALWLIGEKTSEIWYNAGGQYFPFQRLAGTMLQVGCQARYSIARLVAAGQEGLCWLGSSERGENVVIRTQGLTATPISTPAISHVFSTYPVTSDAIGYVYAEDGHEFYVLTFPTADATWVYDASMSPELAWTQRASYDPYAQALHRHRGNCVANFAGMRIVGDYQCGTLHQLTRAAYTDAGWPLLARRRAPVIWDTATPSMVDPWNQNARGRVFIPWLQLDFAPGAGLPSGIWTDPQVGLRISRDGGTSFGTTRYASLGAIGRTLVRAIFRRLGWGRNVVPEIEVIAPVSRDLLGATLYGDSSA